MSSRQVLWTVPRIEEFKRLAILSPFEEKVLDLHTGYPDGVRYADYQIVQKLDGTEFSTSIAAVQTTIRHLKDCYDAVQPYSPILPPRKLHANEMVKRGKAAAK